MGHREIKIILQVKIYKRSFLNPLLFVLINICLSVNTDVYSQAESYDNDHDYIAILYGEKTPSELKRSLEIFDNRQLKGSPSFIIDNFKVKDIRLGNPLGKNKIDFIIYNKSSDYQGHGASLKIERFDKGIAEMLDQGKRYYMKIDPAMFKANEYPDNSRWKVIKGEHARNIFKQLSASEESLKKLLSKGMDCMDSGLFNSFRAIFGEDKRIACLRNYFKEDHRLYTASNLLWAYENLPCDKVVDQNFFINSKEFVWGKHFMIPWSSLKNVFLKKIKLNEVKIKTKDFDKIYRIDIETNEEMFCEGKAQKSIRLSFEKKGYSLNGKDSEWEILFWGFTKKFGSQ